MPLSEEYLAELRQRVVDRLRDEWPGVRIIDNRGMVLIPPVSEGGATEALIQLAADIAIQEIQK